MPSELSFGYTVNIGHEIISFKIAFSFIATLNFLEFLNTSFMGFKMVISHFISFILNEKENVRILKFQNMYKVLSASRNSQLK